MFPRSLRCLLLGVLLVLAQAGAIAHALEHLEDASRHDMAGGNCATCAAFGHVGDAAPAVSSPAVIASARWLPRPVAEPRSIAVACRLPYRSQAPPHRS